jgi:hypothetical protein
MGKQQLEILTDMADSMVVGNQLLEQVAEQLESISEQMLQPGPSTGGWKELFESDDLVWVGTETIDGQSFPSGNDHWTLFKHAENYHIVCKPDSPEYKVIPHNQVKYITFHLA